MTHAAETIAALRPGAGQPQTFAGDLEVSGDIADGAEATIAGSLRVAGAVGSARLSVGNSVELATGVAGRDAATLHAARDVRAVYLNAADLRLGGALHVQREIVGCIITVGGSVLASTASIHGGRLVAAKPVECGTLGSPAGTATLLRLGTIPDLHRVIDRAQELVPALDRGVEQSKAELERLRATITSTGGHKNPANAARAERATELEYDIPNLTAKRGPLLKAVTNTLVLLRKHTTPGLTVHTIAHRGVRVEIDGWQVEFNADANGPWRLEPAPSDDSIDAAATNKPPRFVSLTGESLQTPAGVRISPDPAFDARRAFLERYTLTAIVRATLSGAA